MKIGLHIPPIGATDTDQPWKQAVREMNTAFRNEAPRMEWNGAPTWLKGVYEYMAGLGTVLNILPNEASDGICLTQIEWLREKTADCMFAIGNEAQIGDWENGNAVPRIVQMSRYLENA